MNLAFFADEKVEMEIVDRLKSLRHFAVHAAELSPGRPDTAVLQAATQAGQVLIIAPPALSFFGCQAGLRQPRLDWLQMLSSATAESFWEHSR